VADPVLGIINRCLDLAIMSTGSCSWLASTYASLLPHPNWTMGSVVALDFFVVAMILVTRAVRDNERGSGVRSRPFVYPARRKKKGLFVPQIMILSN